jgi:glycosyltransferase involved in cell wall biosynthesis
MGQALAGSDSITIDPPHKHLGITVGVITRNRAGNLEEMLDSLTRQLRAPDEVLVVDNGSTDNTQAVLERFSDRLPIRRQFLEQANIPGARNLVIESAANEIVSFVDDDCITEPDWLIAVETGFLRADNIGIVGGWVTHEPAPRSSVVENYYRVFHHVKS